MLRSLEDERAAAEEAKRNLQEVSYWLMLCMEASAHGLGCAYSRQERPQERPNIGK